MESAFEKERLKYAAMLDRLHEVEAAHKAQLIELQPFIDLGRIGTSLVHELTNPLTAALLCAGQLIEEHPSDMARETLASLHRLERYLLAARKQIKRESDLRLFSVGVELRQVVQMLQGRAWRAGVKLHVGRIPGVRLYGDAVKFDQILANVIANAIDAAGQAADVRKRIVEIVVVPHKHGAHITVTDHGPGIKLSDMSELFKPFYSSKTSVRAGLGVGLALTKQYVENDFSGGIRVHSSARKGTSFRLRLRDHARAK